jgi:hypothetical protein
MVKTAFSQALRVGRATALALGVAVMLALVVGVASAAFGANGDPWSLGQGNVATAITTLGGTLGVEGPMVRLINNNADANDTALELRVQPGEAPMTVNSSTRVNDLNADQLDGRDSTTFVASNVYKAEDPINAGLLLGDGTRVIAKACGAGDVLLSGGPANINGSGTILLESFPTPGSTNSWTARIANTDGTPDNFNVVVLCANQ